jgi:hypothetical protein
MPSIDLFAAQPEIAQGHFPKSHVLDVPALKSLRHMAHAQNVPAGTKKCTTYVVMSPGTCTTCPRGDRDTSAHFSLHTNVPALC